MRIYIAGPLTTGGERETRNLRKALEAAEVVARLGHTPIVPHLMLTWDQVFPHDYDFWMRLCRGLLEGCEGLVRLPGISKGADTEEQWAGELGIPVAFAWNGEVDCAVFRLQRSKAA